MLLYDIVSLICLAIMLVIIFIIIFKVAKFKRADSINYIRSFKKGKCAIIYLIAVPLFFLSNFYKGKPVFEAFIDGVSNAVYLIGMKYDTANVSALANVCLAFKIAMYLCLCMVVINAIMFVLSLFHQSLWEFFTNLSFRCSGGDKCIIIGNNDKGKAVYKTCKCKKIIVGSLDASAKDKLFAAGVVYKAFVKGKSTLDWLKSDVGSLVFKMRNTRNKVNIIVVEQEEKTKLHICGEFIRYIATLNDNMLRNVAMYVFGDREYEDIYLKYEKHSKGCLHYINDYKQIALDFTDKYPLTAFMDKRHIDYKTSFIKEGIECSVSLIGFGRTNQQIFLSMIANNQFLTKNSDGEVLHKKITYHCFDKKHTDEHKNLNHNYFRYKHDFFDGDGRVCVDKADYLELPDLPAEEKYYYFDVNGKSFYDDLRKIIDKPSTEKINYIIVSLGDDYQSLDIVNKIVSKINEWKIKDCYVFVRVKDKSILKDSKIFLDAKCCFAFGTDEDCVYDYAHIVQEKYSEMSIMKNYIYDIEKDMNHDFVSEQSMAKSRIKWYTEKSLGERESNVYACLGIRTKLNLMGLDFRKKSCQKMLEETNNDILRLKNKKKESGDEELARQINELKWRLQELKKLAKTEDNKKVLPLPLSFKQYRDVYDKEKLMNIVNVSGENGLQVVKYSLDFSDSLRKNLAEQEHLRWNAFMLMNGFVPAKKDVILAQKEGNEYTNGKDYELRHHGNLTSMKGLIEFRKMIAERDGECEEKKDVIKYDYQLLDGAHWLLDKNGYEIYKK